MKTKIWDLFVLRPGQEIEAQDITLRKWRGVVDQVSPEQGMVWVHLESGAGRKLLDLNEHSLWQL